MAKDKKTKIVKAADLRGKTESELMETLMGLRKENMNIRFKRLGGEFKETDKIGKIKKEIARIKTVMTEMKKKPAAPKEAAAKKTAKKEG